MVGNPSCSAAVWEEVGMPDQTQGFVDKADSKYMNFVIGARASLVCVEVESNPLQPSPPSTEESLAGGLC